MSYKHQKVKLVLSKLCPFDYPITILETILMELGAFKIEGAY